QRVLCRQRSGVQAYAGEDGTLFFDGKVAAGFCDDLGTCEREVGDRFFFSARGRGGGRCRGRQGFLLRVSGAVATQIGGRGGGETISGQRDGGWRLRVCGWRAQAFLFGQQLQEGVVDAY